MYLRMAKRLLFNTNKRLLWNLAYKAGFKGIRAVQKHKKRLKGISPGHSKESANESVSHNYQTPRQKCGGVLQTKTVFEQNCPAHQTRSRIKRKKQQYYACR